MSTDPQANKELIERYYANLWNRWDDGEVDSLISPDVIFHGSIGVGVQGRPGFRQYVATVREAFPDFHNQVEEIIAEDDKVAARLTYTGTHLGRLFEAPPTGKKIAYVGIAIFRVVQGQVVDGWVQGDTLGLLRRIGDSRVIN